MQRLFYSPSIILERMADIVDIAVSAGSFQTLVTAVQAAGLVETLKAPVHLQSLLQMTTRLRSSQQVPFKL